MFFTIQVDIWEVWGCPGGGHGLYEEIPSNFGGVWSYRTWGKSIFMFLGNIKIEKYGRERMSEEIVGFCVTFGLKEMMSGKVTIENEQMLYGGWGQQII